MVGECWGVLGEWGERRDRAGEGGGRGGGKGEGETGGVPLQTAKLTM